MLRVEADKLHELLEMQYLPKILEINVLEEFNKTFADYKGKIITIMNSTARFKENISTNENQINKHEFILTSYSMNMNSLLLILLLH